MLNTRPLVLTPNSDDLFPIALYQLLTGPLLMPLAFNHLRIITELPNMLCQLLDGIKESFWKRWNSAYLCLILKRQKWKVNKREEPLKGSIVTVSSGTKPGEWLMGIEIECNKSTDGIARDRNIRLANKNVI
jgi:Family of unknown function (DUF5641)